MYEDIFRFCIKPKEVMYRAYREVLIKACQDISSCANAHVFIIRPRRIHPNIKPALAAAFSNGIISMIMNRTPNRAPGVSPQLAFP